MPSDNFHFSIPLEVQRGFDPILKDLVGHTGENPIEHEWYTGPIYTQPYLGQPVPEGTEVGLFKPRSGADGKNAGLTHDEEDGWSADDEEEVRSEE